MPRFFLVALTCIVTAALTACTNTQTSTPQPIWVDTPSAARPASLYLTAVGVGATRDEAHDRALARLAEQIVADVRSQTIVARDSTYRARPGAAPSATEMLDEESVVTVSSRTVLAAASVAEYWRDPAPSATTFHALAVLDRERATAFYDEWIAGHEEWTRRQLALAERAGPTWQRLQSLGAALAHARRRDELAMIRAIIAPPGAPALADRLTPAVQSIWDDSADLLRIELQSHGAAGGVFARGVRESLSNLALHADADPDAPLILRVYANTFRGSTYREGERVALREYIFEFAAHDGAAVAARSFETWRAAPDEPSLDPAGELFELDAERLRPQIDSLLADFLNLTPPDIVLLSAAPQRRPE